MCWVDMLSYVLLPIDLAIWVLLFPIVQIVSFDHLPIDSKLDEHVSSSLLVLIKVHSLHQVSLI